MGNFLLGQSENECQTVKFCKQGVMKKWRMCIVCFSIYMYLSAINKKKSKIEWEIRETDKSPLPSFTWLQFISEMHFCSFFSVYIPSFILSENLPPQNRTWLQPGGCLIDMFYILNYLTLTYFINSDLAFLHCWSSENLLHPITCLCHWINSMEGLL